MSTLATSCSIVASTVVYADVTMVLARDAPKSPKGVVAVQVRRKKFLAARSFYATANVARTEIADTTNAIGVVVMADVHLAMQLATENWIVVCADAP